MKTTELKKGFRTESTRSLLRAIYIDESVLDYQKRTFYQSNREL